MKILTPDYIINKRRLSNMPNSNVSVEEMWKTLENCGINRKSLEKIHPSPETISHIYSSLKNQKRQ
ncbi:MAG: hypothetical protein KGI25_02055 [Thaumarchaeota archaeon]|nr:hypothetical protein [Nitrososphaerota archaeon]